MLTADAHTAGPSAPAGRLAGASRVGLARSRDTVVAAAGPATNPIRVLLVDDKPLAREGLRALLAEQPGMQVVAQAAGADEATALDVRPDVVIADLALTDSRGRDTVRRLCSHFTCAAILVLADVDHGPEVDQIVAAGVGGYVLKTTSTLEFLHGIRTVAQRTQYVHPAVRRSGVVSSGGADPATCDLVDSLTAKERDVMRFLVLGHTNAEIARLCNVSLRTVEARRARVLAKLGVRSRADLVRIAKQAGHGIDFLDNGEVV